MRKRSFNIGDRIVCIPTGVVGKCIKFYTPTACQEQTMVLTDDGRRYHAPTSEWATLCRVSPRGYVDLEEDGKFESNLNPYGKYLVEFVRNHGLTIDQASEQLMAKARLHYFNETGL